MQLVKINIFHYLLSFVIILGLNYNTTYARNKKITFAVILPNGICAEKVKAYIPNLKYNKKIVASWTTDDSYSIYNAIFCAINKKYIDKEKMSFFNTDDTRDFVHHLNGEESEGYIPSKALTYTDGCGIKHRFATSIAYWTSKLTDKTNNSSKFNPHATLEELTLAKDFGFSLCYHDLEGYNKNDSQTPLNTQEVFDDATKKSADLFQSIIGVTPKIMIEPNGDHTYESMSKSNPIIKAVIAQNIGDYLYPFKADVTFDKKEAVIRHFNTSTEELIKELNINLNLPEIERKWIINGAHKESSAYVTKYLSKVEELFGASGKDCIWFPSLDEYYEYSYMRKNTIISQEIIGNRIYYTLDIPVEDNFYFQSLSVLLDGINSIEGLEVKSDQTTFGTSYGISDNKLLVNLDFNESLPQKAEKYTAIFEKEKTLEAYEDATYFISQLKKEIKKPFILRINSLISKPEITNISVNDGASKLNNPLISIKISCSTNVCYYRVSETVDFKSAKWMAIQNNIYFQLSSEIGEKELYIQVKNALEESEIKKMSLLLCKYDKKVVIGLSGSKTNENNILYFNNEILNNINPSINDNWPNIPLYDSSKNQVMNFVNNRNELNMIIHKYGIKIREGRSVESFNPIFSTEQGEYPNEIIRCTSFFGSADKNGISGESRLVFAIKNVPIGYYNIRLLGSQNRHQTKEEIKLFRYQVNNSSIPLLDSDIFYNNNCKFIEINNIFVDDETIVISSWRSPHGPHYGVYAPINLIEIKQVEKSATGVPELDEKQTIVYSGKGKLSIENHHKNSIALYRIDGTIVQQIIPSENSIEITLPEGIYIIDGKKGIVY